MLRMAPSPLLAVVAAACIAAVFLSRMPAAVAKTVNSTRVLAKYSHLSTFNRYLSETGVIKEVDSRSSITLFIPPNAVLDPVIASVGGSNLLVIADILRYHCVLQYLEVKEIRSMTNSTGITLATLYQTTGKPTGEFGFVNVSVSHGGLIHLGVPGGASNATVVRNITQHPYDMSYMELDHPLMPMDLGIDQGAAPSVNNLTAVLKSKGNFNTFLGLLASTGIDKALRSMSAVTLLAPDDDAFKALPPNALAELSQAQKIALLQFHAIATYFTMGSLQSVATPLPTVASSRTGGFELNVTTTSSGTSKSVSFVTGLNRAQVTDTELDTPPVAVYAINRVLLPPEIFAIAPAGAPGPALSVAPELSPAPTPGPSSSPTPTPSPSPSPSPEAVPSPAPVMAPAASPPAPPTSETPSASSLAPEELSPGRSPNAARPSVSLDRSALVAAGIFAWSLIFFL